MAGTSERLTGMGWLSFSKYPKQGSDIILHASGKDLETDETVHRFIRMTRFNAATFNSSEMRRILGLNARWDFTWLPADVINAACKVGVPAIQN